MSGMSNQAFSTTSGNPLTAQPVTASKIIVRSTDSGYSGSVSVYGLVSASPALGFTDPDGMLEVTTSVMFGTISQVIADVAAGVITGLAPGVSAVGDVRCDANPSDGHTLEIGLTGHTISYRFKNTLAAANDVKIGATPAATMLSLYRAIILAGTAGVDYHADTSRNPVYLATVNTNVVTLTDFLPCLRQLAPVVVQSNADFSIRIPVGGVDGIALFTIPAGQTSAANALTFSNPARDTATLPALMLATCGYVPVGGSQAMYRIYTSQAIAGNFEYSDDLLTWRATSEGTLTLGSGGHSAKFAELHEYLRFKVLTNANTTDTILDARVVW